MSEATQSVGEIVQTHVDAGRHRIFVNRAGEGNAEAVILLHGSGPGATAYTNWHLALPAVGSRFDAIAPDMLGYGESSHPEPAPTSNKEWTRLRVEATLDLLDALGLERAHLIGNSMGGRLALGLVIRAPERFDRVVLMGSSGAPGEPTLELQRLMTFYDNPTPEAMAELLTFFVYDEQMFGGKLQEIAEERLAAAMRDDIRRSFVSTFAPPLDMALPPTALSRIYHPVLLVHGRDDPVVPLAGSEYLSRVLPNNQLHVFGRCSHWVQIEQARPFNNLVSAFLAGEI
jgi:2-hydroxymuconate-semialdehyde hydrolase